MKKTKTSLLIMLIASMPATIFLSANIFPVYAANKDVYAHANSGGTVTYSPVGSGSGTVPAGTTSHFTVAAGTTVTFTANPSTGYSFGGWSGAGQSGTTNPKSIAVGSGIGSSSDPLTASFTQNNYALSLSVSPSGAGSIGKSPDQSTYHYGEQVSLTATAATGWTFNHWTGDVTGSASPVTLTVDTDPSATAVFHYLTTISELKCNPESVPSNGGSVYFTGKLTCNSDGQGVGGMTVKIFCNTGSGYVQRGITTTENDGTFSTMLNPWLVPVMDQGFYIVKATFDGSDPFDGCFKETINGAGNGGLLVVPEYVLGGLSALGICFAGVIIFKKRSSLPQLRRPFN